MTLTLTNAADMPRRRGALFPPLPVRPVLRRLAAWLRERRRRRVARQAFMNLVYLDDRALADIGVSRHDVERAGALPLHVDAALILQEWRRQARRL